MLTCEGHSLRQHVLPASCQAKWANLGGKKGRKKQVLHSFSSRKSPDVPRDQQRGQTHPNPPLCYLQRQKTS